MLTVKNVTKSFNTTGNITDTKIALNNLNLTVEEGQFVTIIGGNGSGKSTLMNIISGVYIPDFGEIYIDDIDVTKLKEYHRAKFLGRVFQDPNMGTAGSMTIEENLEIASRRGKAKTLKWGFDKKNREPFKKILADLDLGLETRMTQKVGLLSGGQRQAVTLLMATFIKPKLLLLDEHTAALDPKTARKVLAMTEKIVTENKLTTIMITHNMKDAIKYGNRMIMMYGGKIIYDVSGQEKQKLTVEDLLKKFDEQDDLYINSTIL